jgi:hypothetical protein
MVDWRKGVGFTLAMVMGASQLAHAAPTLQSQRPEGMQPLFALAANLCVGAMRMGNSLPLRVLDSLGESPSLGVENRLFSDAERQIEVMLAGSSPGQPEGAPILCLAQPRQAMAAADKAALRDWAEAELARMASADDVAAFEHESEAVFTRIIYWCDGGGKRIVLAFSQAAEDSDIRMGVTHSLPGGAAPDCPGG